MQASGRCLKTIWRGLLLCTRGSEYIEGSDPWNGTWNVKQWTKEQECLLCCYKQQLDEKTFLFANYPWIELFVNADGQIFYANSGMPALDLSQAKKGRIRKIISAQEAYSMGAAILQKQKLNQSKILSVKLCYSHKKYINVEENEKAVGASASIIPCLGDLLWHRCIRDKCK